MTEQQGEYGFEKLLETLRESSFPEAEITRITQAYVFARNAHEGQLRRSGEPYIIHPVAVAEIRAEMGMDGDAIGAAVLHDVVEDTPVTSEEVKRLFGPAVAFLVEGVTKLGKVPLQSREEQQAENLRKLLLAMSEDIRVIIIKLADRLHNMRTLAAMPEDRRLDIAKETLAIYAPIAHRLGIRPVKEELEDLAISYLDPVAYGEIEHALEEQASDRKEFLDELKAKITARVKLIVNNATIEGRIKSVHGIYRKMYMQGKSFEEIYDIYAVRIIVDTVSDCYNCLGLMHDMYRPIQGRFKDYISTPKPNMYQSLHTTVIGSEGIPFEVQIRTWEMHHTAEYGIAAHWKYKMGEGAASLRTGDEDRFAWVRRLLESQQESDAQDFFHNLKIDMFADEVFVFSPKGDVINLPAGATPIDFAYMIHSDVGNHMVSASVNGRIVTFDYVLQNGDIVEIRTSKSAPGPSRDWLNIAKSGSARTKIKQWYKRERREENVIRGREMLEDELKQNGLTLDDVVDEAVMSPILRRLSYSNVDDRYAAIGYGGLTAVRAANRLKDEYARVQKPDRKTTVDKLTEAAERREQQAAKQTGKPIHGVLVAGLDNCLVKFSRCCTPVPGDDIVGFITRGQGVSIHRRDCANCQQLLSQPENEGRWVEVSWASKITDSYLTTIVVSAKDRSGLVMDVATVLNALNAKVHSLSARTTGLNIGIVTVTLEVRDAAELRRIISRLTHVNGVSSVTRNGM